MIQSVDDGLRRRLDRLEMRGRSVLSTLSHRQVLSRALALAAPASVIGPLALAASAPLVPPSLVAATFAVILPPISAAALVFVREGLRTAQPRAAALALMDSRLQLNDRLQTSDEFLGLAHRSAFHDAALQEAAPWVARAQDSAIDRGVRLIRPRRSRLWLWPVAGLLLLAAAFFIPQFATGAGEGAAKDATADLPSRSAAAASGASSADQLRTVGASPPSSVGQDGAAAASPGQDKAGGGLVSAFQRLMARLSSSRGASTSAQGAGARPAQPSQAAAGGEGAGRGGQGAAGTRASRAAAGQNAEGDQTRDTAAPVSGEAGSQDDADAAASEATKGQFAGARQAAPSAARPQAPESNAGSPQPGEGQQPGRSRRGDQSQSNGEQSGGQGENGSQAGAEAGPKKSRGVSSLMLATPMQDRLGGMVSPGRIRTTTRDGVPQPLPAGPASAQDRGTAQGEAARTAPLAASAQEQRVTRDYFNARNGGGG